MGTDRSCIVGVWVVGAVWRGAGVPGGLVHCSSLLFIASSSTQQTHCAGVLQELARRGARLQPGHLCDAAPALGVGALQRAAVGAGVGARRVHVHGRADKQQQQQCGGDWAPPHGRGVLRQPRRVSSSAEGVLAPMLHHQQAAVYQAGGMRVNVGLETVETETAAAAGNRRSGWAQITVDTDAQWVGRLGGGAGQVQVQQG